MLVRFLTEAGSLRELPDSVFAKISKAFSEEKDLLSVSPGEVRQSSKDGLAVVGFSGSGKPIAFTRLIPLLPPGSSDGVWYELGSTWVHPRFRRRGIGRDMYEHFLELHKDKDILATTTSVAALGVGVRLGFVAVPRRSLPESVWRASCVCPPDKTGCRDNSDCRLAWKEPQEKSRRPCVFRVTRETAERRGLTGLETDSITTGLTCKGEKVKLGAKDVH